MHVSSLLSLCWELLKSPAGLIVVFGVTGEVVLDYWKRPRDQEQRERLKRTFGLILILGLLLELPESARLREEAANANRLAAELTQTNLVLRGQVASLELRALEMSSNVAKIDPKNLPITFIKANAVLFVRGTNFWKSDDGWRGKLVMLEMGNRAWCAGQHTFKVILQCKDHETYWGADGAEWVLEFGPGPMPGAFGATWNLTEKDVVRSADEWDLVFLHADFLHDGTEVMRGWLTLTINTTVKEFEIPRQVAVLHAGEGYDEIKLVGSTVTNGLNVIVGSGP